MSPDLSILKPLFVQVGLTFTLLFWMGKERYQAVTTGNLIPGDPGSRPTWKGRAAVVSNAFHNQLEMPMLFYVAVILAIITSSADYSMTALAWLFAMLRVVHAAIHTTYNKVPHRFGVFILSNLVLLAMWAKLALHVLTAG
ncbi:MAG: MAPEG family protein [Deltaproteobacteria bacterium]